MNVIDKYLTESTLKSDKSSIKKMVQTPPKSGKYIIDDEVVVITSKKDSLDIEYPKALTTFTYNIIQICDSLGNKLDFVTPKDKSMERVSIDLS